MDDDVLTKYGYIKASSYRIKIMFALINGVKTPTDISNESGIRPNHISKVLRELKDVGAVECINEKARKGRLYRLTSLGEDIMDELY